MRVFLFFLIMPLFFLQSCSEDEVLTGISPAAESTLKIDPNGGSINDILGLGLPKGPNTKPIKSSPSTDGDKIDDSCKCKLQFIELPPENSTWTLWTPAPPPIYEPNLHFQYGHDFLCANDGVGETYPSNILSQIFYLKRYDELPSSLPFRFNAILSEPYNSCADYLNAAISAVGNSNDPSLSDMVSIKFKVSCKTNPPSWVHKDYHLTFNPNELYLSDSNWPAYIEDFHPVPQCGYDGNTVPGQGDPGTGGGGEPPCC